ncbi:MAG: hypothetical protein ACOC98_03320, partial [Thermodesulfobacteriota bacterium]
MPRFRARSFRKMKQSGVEVPAVGQRQGLSVVHGCQRFGPMEKPCAVGGPFHQVVPMRRAEHGVENPAAPKGQQSAA